MRNEYKRWIKGYLLGAHPLAFRMRRREDIPGGIPLQLQACSIASLTVWMIVKGILEIYGTTNKMIAVYPVAAAVLLCFGFAAYLIPLLTLKRLRRYI